MLSPPIISQHKHFGVWPSGKAADFGSAIRGFESLYPSHIQSEFFIQVFLILLSLHLISTVDNSSINIYQVL